MTFFNLLQGHHTYGHSLFKYKSLGMPLIQIIQMSPWNCVVHTCPTAGNSLELQEEPWIQAACKEQRARKFCSSSLYYPAYKSNL